MILTCDGDVRDRFQSVTDGVAVAGGGRPGSPAREVEPVVEVQRDSSASS